MNGPAMYAGVAIGMALVILAATTNHAAAAEPPLPRVPTEGWGLRGWGQHGKGHHRALVRVSEQAAGAEAVEVVIPWRRRDIDPASKAVVVIGPDPAGQIRNVVPLEINNEYGRIAFQPGGGAGEYFFYYLPFIPNRDVFAPPAEYIAPRDSAEAAWRERAGLSEGALAAGKAPELPRAECVRIEARGEFHRCDPMGLIAWEDEIAALLESHPDAPYLVFCEDRTRPARMKRHLPMDWAVNGPKTSFSGEARPGEHYAFQIGVWAARQDLPEISLEVPELRGDNGATIPASAVRCVNLGGIDDRGETFRKPLAVPAGRVQVLWVIVDVPADAAPGAYAGTFRLATGRGEATEIPVTIAVAGEKIPHGGAADLWRYARLAWLDSTLASEPEVFEPYTPVRADGASLEILDRRIDFAYTGLPEQITSRERPLLAEPMAIAIESGGERREVVRDPDLLQLPSHDMSAHSPAAVERQTPIVFEDGSGGALLRGRIDSRTEFDGAIEFSLTLAAAGDAPVELGNLALELPLRAAQVPYMMGMARRGGRRPERWGWRWDPRRETNLLWLGGPDAGLQLKLRPPDRNYERNFDDDGDFAWCNSGRGGCVVFEEADGEILRVRAFTGALTIRPEEQTQLRFRLLVTPFHPIGSVQWSRKLAAGRNGLCFHGTKANPYINYPFQTVERIRGFIDAHREKNERIDVYYTNTQISDRTAEIWALRTLGDEILRNDKQRVYFGDKAVEKTAGGGYPWLREHLVHDYVPTWRQPLPWDAIDGSVGVHGRSRWTNYYIEGLNWLIEHAGLEGLYLDGIEIDRLAMQRVRRLMCRKIDEPMIRLHGGNGFDWGDKRESSMNHNMDLMPYFDQIWFGEGFSYDRGPDYYLVEISGICVGLTGQMLEYHTGGNPWRGMLFGMPPYAVAPQFEAVMAIPEWFDIDSAELLGYWDDACPVSTGREDVLASVYRLEGRSLIAVASWAGEDRNVRLEIDWDALGLDPATTHLRAPAMEHFQGPRTFQPDDAIPVPPGRGLLLLAEPADTPATE